MTQDQNGNEIGREETTPQATGVGAPAAPAQQAAAPQAGEVKRKTSDGRIAVFDANKRFLRYE